jgi:hypothetical protein
VVSEVLLARRCNYGVIRLVLSECLRDLTWRYAFRRGSDSGLGLVPLTLCKRYHLPVPGQAEHGCSHILDALTCVDISSIASHFSSNSVCIVDSESRIEMDFDMTASQLTYMLMPQSTQLTSLLLLLFPGTNADQSFSSELLSYTFLAEMRFSTCKSARTNFYLEPPGIYRIKTRVPH